MRTNDKFHCLRLLKRKWLTVLRIKKTPKEIALGLAFGVFVGFIPIIPFQSIWAIGLCWVFGGSKLAAFAGAWVSNPVTVPPLFAAFYYVGKRAFPGIDINPLSFYTNLDWFSTEFIFDTGWKIALILNAGGVIVGIPTAVVSYFVTLNLARQYQARKMRRQLDAKGLS
ncbi:DUF2062 domain-containing protein [Fundidesulfovibrio soli]|uniref:DUF2062 domain-containing protein n=1 Tax=Fundidesulfovibrio soli TaxID=2922716 RepID=UPI001FAF2F7C|nr:DUF2062 domain-containing protein [Fundidesulfovibrio soli]